MASDDLASGHNIKGEDVYVPNPNKVKPKPQTASTPASDTGTTATPAPPPPPPPVQEQVVVVAAPQPQPQMSQPNYMMGQQAAQTQSQPNINFAPSSGDQQGADEQTSKENEHWMKSYWRPAMGWLYMVICFMDFVGFPLLTIFLPIIFKPFGLVMPYTAWQSLTLSNGGLIHLSFGAILGVSAWSRGQEKKV